jgi:hypothetical protein
MLTTVCVTTDTKTFLEHWVLSNLFYCRKINRLEDDP